MYAAPRVTGHSAHALNSMLVWLPLALLLPLSWYWILPTVFYTLREIPDLLVGHGDWLDHVGDVMWVYAIGIALWTTWPFLLAWLLFVAVMQVLYWMRPAPGWMPREALLWGTQGSR